MCFGDYAHLLNLKNSFVWLITSIIIDTINVATAAAPVTIKYYKHLLWQWYSSDVTC